jgi:predicted MFS family arabinose efflux permease
MLVGDVVAARLLPPPTRERLLVAFVVLLGAPLVLLALPLPVAAVAVVLSCSGMGFAYGLSVARRFRDAVPEDRRGQAFSLLRTGLMTCQGLGPALFGGLAELVPTAAVIAAGGVATVLAGVALHRTRAPEPELVG